MKEIQQKVKEFCQKNNLEMSPENRILDTLSELGELSKEILRSTNYGREERKDLEELKTELGDVFYCIINLANELNINLEEALDLILEKYERRLKKGSADSVND
jgi:NTP pyrophosphatase (non-canonical NTP hydrolase)